MTPPTDPIEILLAHNHWANLGFLRTAQTLTQVQFHQRFEIGPGSVHDTLSHVLGAMQRWIRGLHGQELLLPPRFEDTQRTADELLTHANALHEAMTAVARAHPAGETVTVTRNSQPIVLLRSAILTHITTHGLHHRAQCANMFRQLGIKTPPSSVIEWTLSLNAPVR